MTLRRTRAAVGGVFHYQARGRRRWGIDYRDGSGRRRRKRGFRTRLAALGWEKDHALSGLGVRGAVPRFKAAIKSYREHVEQEHLDSSYRYLDLWLEAFERRPIDTITADEIEAHLARWVKNHAYSKATRNRILAQLSGAFSWWVRKKWIRHHPISRVIGRLEEDNARDRWLRMDEIKAILEQCDPWLRDIVLYAPATGMRLGEICALTTSSYQVDQAGKAYLRTGRTKNRRELAWPVEGWVRELVELRVKAAVEPGFFLFPGPAGGNARTSILRALPKAVRAAELTWGKGDQGVTFHTLRHTMASLALNSGTRLEVVQRMGNWKDRRSVERYAHLADETLREASASLAQFTRSAYRLRTLRKKAPRAAGAGTPRTPVKSKG